jgi:hypothetical protein
MAQVALVRGLLQRCLSLAADAGSFAALSCENVGVAGAGVAPAQIFVQPAAEDGVVRVVRAGHGEHA